MILPNDRPRTRRTKFALTVAAVLSTVAGCTNGSGNPDTPTPSTSSPRPTPTTATEVRALVQEIPLDGNTMVPIRWRLPDVNNSALEQPLLTARQYIAVRQILYTQENPSSWIPYLLATADEPAKVSIKDIQESSPLPWEERLIGPSSTWIMNTTMKFPGKAQITYCADNGWQGNPAYPPTKRRRTGWIETVEVTYLKNFSGGPVWKVTELWPRREQAVNRPYIKRCDAWWKTHTSTEGWMIPTPRGG
jgi:hypothetical protein